MPLPDSSHLDFKSPGVACMNPSEKGEGLGQGKFYVESLCTTCPQRIKIPEWMSECPV